MKRIILLFILIAASTSTFAQLDKLYYNKTYESLRKKGKVPFKEPGKIVINAMPGNRYNMPVVELKSQGTYKGNNGDGADIYAYSPDNMPVLKPDSTFRSNMLLHYRLQSKEKFTP
jgi:hypothetical protein